MNRFQKLISHLFHPITFPVIAGLLFFMYSPRYANKEQIYAILATIFVSTYIIPLLFMYILKRFKMITNYHLTITEERKFPFIFLTTLSFLLGNMFYKIGFVADLATYFFGTTLALIIGYLFLLVAKKISLHLLGIGSLVGFVIVLSFGYQLNLLILLSVLIILSGLIAVSRLQLKAHNMYEVYVGFAVGLSMQIAAYFIIYKIATQYGLLSYL